jgi:hypothetical protein
LSDSSDAASEGAWPEPDEGVDLDFLAALGPPLFFVRLVFFFTADAVPFFFAAVWEGMLDGSVVVDGG